MSVIVHGLHNGDVVLEDMAGEIHTLPLLWHSAIDEAIHAGEVGELDHCTFTADGRTCDQAALRGDSVCPRHLPDDNPNED